MVHLPQPRGYINTYILPLYSSIISENAWPIKAKFYMNNPDHMTKMATMPIFGLKSFPVLED